MQQLWTALSNAGLLLTAMGLISSNLTDPGNIAWNSATGASAATTDPLYNVLSSVGYPGGVPALYAAAAALPANSPGSGAVAQAVVFRNIIDIADMSRIFGTLRESLGKWPWNWFQPLARVYSSLPKGPPAVFSVRQDSNTFYVFSIPDQSYSIDVDVVTLTDPLTNLTDTETEILPPNDRVVHIYALYLAFLSLQQYGPADYYFARYHERKNQIQGAKRTTMRPNPYGTLAEQIRRLYGPQA